MVTSRHRGVQIVVKGTGRRVLLGKGVFYKGSRRLFVEDLRDKAG